MDDWDKINAVDRMQSYIQDHLDEEITMQDLSDAAGYSLWHSLRLFKEYLQKTPFEYIRAMRLTAAARQLRDSPAKVIDAAMDHGFDSHDGFTRAFSKHFQITPRRYQNEKPPVRYFTHYPIRHSYLHNTKRSDETMKKGLSSTITVQAAERPARKMILLRSAHAADYFSFCEEKGCEWEGLLNSVAEKMDAAACITLPMNLTAAGTSPIAAGIEVPADYAKAVPEGYDIIDLPPCTLLYFRGMPYENEEDFGEAITIAFDAVEHYKPELYGYALADELCPRFNFGASGDTGAKLAIPVKPL